MHFVVAWEIEARGNKAEEIDKKMRHCLREYTWVCPFGQLYIVKVRSSKQWEKINEDLSEVANYYGNAEINFITGPLMKGGRYDGILPGNFWNSINEITG